ncbi:MAG: Rrf2 family transcriptional regulator [Candidatus Omnitrophica bacterium]|nr:Rrf2 family transcriptional regulator [Candidatus Omnitrophota bacterium]
MKLSTRSTYGMRALVELALSSGRGPVSASSIAKRQDLSVAYLEQLLHRLKKHGLINSVRGPRGGYVLARDSHTMTMAEVVAVLEGNHGTHHNGTRRSMGSGKGRAPNRVSPKSSRVPAEESHRHAQRIAQAVWRCVHERLTESLGTVTLQDLCDEVRTEAGEPLDHRYVFHI